MQGTTDLDNAVFIDVVDHKNGIAGQRTIGEFEKDVSPIIKT